MTLHDGKFRAEEDALGNVQVPAARLWGAQTQRSRSNFPIGTERYRWGRPVIRAMGILKKCAALANEEAAIPDDQSCGHGSHLNYKWAAINSAARSSSP